VSYYEFMRPQRQPDDALSVLGDASRRAILERLTRGPQSVGDIAAKLPISRPAVSRHLRLLQSVGLVSVTRVGTRHFYRLDSAGTEAVKEYLDRVWGEAATRFQLVARNLRPRRR
jgi:DNA-binding transcriptional ArsR family regulator